MRNRNLYAMLAAAALLLAALACGPAATVVVTATPQGVGEAGPAATVIVTATPQGVGEAGTGPTSPPVATSVPDVTAAGGCTLNAGWVADVTVPDNTEFPPSTAFVKTWRVRNSGTCAWEAGTQLVYVSGDPLGGPASVSVPAVAPGATTDISVNFVAPATPGTYRSTWQMQSPAGVRFGSQMWVQIVVPAPATTAPTSTPAATSSAGPPDLVITNLVVDTASPQQGVPLHIVATIRNQGGTAANNFRWAWRVCATCDYIEAPGTLTLGPGEETTAQLEYTFSSWANYTTDAVVDSRGEIAESDEGNNGRQLVIPVRAAPPAEPTTLTLHRTARSGESTTEGRGTRVRVGIDSAGRGFRGFLDFDLSQLPGLGNQAEIRDARLDLSDYSGSCFEFLGPLHVYRVDYGTQIDAGDYNSTPQSTVLDAGSDADIFSPIDVTSRIQGFVEHEGAGHFQLRLQLDHDNLGAAYACLMEWSDATLTVTYRP